MKKTNLFFITVVFFGLLLSCSNNEKTTNSEKSKKSETGVFTNSKNDNQMELLKLKTKEAPSIEVAALEDTKSTKRPIVFAHGATMGSWDFEEYFLSYFFGKGYNVYALNFRGHGESELNKDFNAVSMADFVQDYRSVVELAKERTGKNPILIGHSLGAILTQAYLKEYETETAVFISMADPSIIFPSIIQFYVDRFPEGKKRVDAGDMGWFSGDANFIRVYMFGEETNPKMDGWAKRMVDQGVPETAMSDITGSHTIGDAKGNPKVFIVIGENDPTTPKQSIENAMKTYNADNIIIEDIYHGIPTSKNWQKAADGIINWLEK
jgi:pimeloyl-ACP methyl ester carboxylesterase